MARDYTKDKHSDLIKYGTFFKEKKKAPEAGQLKTYSKKGKIIESGAPGTLSREHDKAMVRLNKIMSLKRKEGGTRTGPGTEKARTKKLASLQKATYQGGGRALRGFGKAYMKGGRAK